MLRETLAPRDTGTMRFFIFILFILIAGAALWFFHPYFRTQREQKHELMLYGNVDVRQVDLGFRVSGRIQSMPFQEGDIVNTGDLMARLDNQPYEDQVREAQARVDSLKWSLVNAQNVLDRRASLIGTQAVAREDYEDALSKRDIQRANLDESVAALGIAETHLRDIELYAPANGTILTRIREPGAIVREADPIYSLSLSTPVWVRAYVSEPQLGLIYPGMPAKVYTDTPGGKVYNGHIGFISPVAEFTPKTVETTQLRTDLVYRLRIIADNPDQGLRQGMPVTIELSLEAARDHL